MALTNADRPEPLSHDAATIIAQRISEFDRAIDAEIERVRGATATIASAYENVNTTWKARQALARELGLKAAEDWNPPQRMADGQPMSAHSNAVRFMRSHPFPPPNSINSGLEKRAYARPSEESNNF